MAAIWHLRRADAFVVNYLPTENEDTLCPQHSRSMAKLLWNWSEVRDTRQRIKYMYQGSRISIDNPSIDGVPKGGRPPVFSDAKIPG